MKNKIAIIVLIIAIVVIVGGISFYFIQKNKTPNNSVDNTASSTSKVGTNNQIDSEQPQNKLVTDDFEISLPEGWRKATPAMGALVIAIKANEQLADPVAQKINFRSYFAVSHDALQGKGLSEYLQSIKNQLQQTISDTVFSQERDVTINNKSAKAFEASFTQQEVNFKILMVGVKGMNDDIWIISFNTLQSTWNEYQETFSDIANSFNLKLKN